MTCPHQAEDLLRHERITELHCTRQARAALATVKRVDGGCDAYASAIWRLPLDAGGGPPRQLSSGSALDTSPRWSPDGRCIAFLSTRVQGLEQIFLMPADGGEARQLSRLAHGLMSHAWHPDGRSLLAVASISVDPDAHGGRPEAPVQRDADAPQVMWRLPYKLDGAGYQLAREFHLFTIDAATGTSRQLTDGPFDVTSATWSPNGRHIAYARRREGRAAHASDIWVMDADGANARQLSHEQPTAMAPSWSPDGQRIVFTGNVDEGDAQSRLWLIDFGSGQVQPLGDESLEIVAQDEMTWAADGRSVVVLVARRGRQHAVRVSVPEGQATPLVTGDRQLSALAGNDERLVYASVTADRLDALAHCDWQGGDERGLCHFNDWFDDRPTLRAEARRFTVPDGAGGTEEIEGWLLRRADAPAGPQPLLVDVHGGPASYVLLSYSAHPHWNVLCDRGWSVLALNPVGSSSFGRPFASRLRGKWGELDLPQQLAAVAQLQAEGLADERVAISGKSYGGYLSAWAIGHTHSFRAAVVNAPVGNLETHYGTSDSGYYSDPYAMCGEPFINREVSVRLSPMKHVEKARTPTLFLQGAEDERCPKCQSEELFVTFMRASDTPAELVVYPNGSHHLLEDGKPSHRVDMVRRLVAWVQRWMGVSAPAGASAGADT